MVIQTCKHQQKHKRNIKINLLSLMTCHKTNVTRDIKFTVSSQQTFSKQMTSIRDRPSHIISTASCN